MNYEFGILSWILFLSFMASLLIAVFSWKKRILSNSFYLSLLTFATAEWAFGGMFEAAATDVSIKIIWSQIAYIGIVLTPVFYLFFALSYSHQNHLLTKRNTLLSLIIPCITLIVALTNNTHHLLWQDVVISDFHNTGIYTHGKWFYVSMTYGYLLIVFGLTSIIRANKNLSASLGAQIKIVVLGGLIPLLANVIYVFDLNPIPGLDWTPIGFGFSGILFAIGIFRYGMLSIVPMARDFLVETMDDGLLVLDVQDHVVDVNPAMAQIIGLPDSKTIGRSMTRVLADWQELLDVLTANDEYRATFAREIPGEGLQYYDIQVTWISHSGNNLSGRMVLCRNTTELEKAKIALNQFG